MTQPFIITKDVRKTKRLINSGEIGLAHNGVIRMTSNGDKDYSDTALFISRYASLLLRSRKDNHNPYVHDMLAELVGNSNRLAILSADGHIDLVGNWTKFNGLNVSNTFWIPTTNHVKKSEPNRYSYKTYYPSWKHQLMESYQGNCKKEHESIYDRVASTALSHEEICEILGDMEDAGEFV